MPPRLPHDEPGSVSLPISDASKELPAFLRRCRERLDPALFGLAHGRRRTPGLRREEVAQRAHVSVTWYTWLEQGRGGAPSADMLGRLARALDLTDDERDHLFTLARLRPPSRAGDPSDPSLVRLQAVLDSLEGAAAFVKNHRWDVLAWNHGACAVLTDYAKLRPHERNVLEILFCTPEPRERMGGGWEADARGAIAAFRREIARANALASTQPLIESLCARSDTFRRFWDEGAVASLADGRKVVDLPEIGRLTLDYNAFDVEAAPHLAMVVYTAGTEVDRRTLAAAISRYRKSLLVAPPV